MSYCVKCGKIKKIDLSEVKALIKKFEKMGYHLLSTELTGDPNHQNLTFMTRRRKGEVVMNIKMQLKRAFGSAVKNTSFKGKSGLKAGFRDDATKFDVELRW